MNSNESASLFKASRRVVSPADGERVSVVGAFTFKWSTAEFPSLEFLESIRSEGDDLADAALAALLRLHKALEACKGSDPQATPAVAFAPHNMASFLMRVVAALDPAAVPKASTGADENNKTVPPLNLGTMSPADRDAVMAFWRAVTTVPSWVDWASVARGQSLYWKYFILNAETLSSYSLLGGYAADSINQVLVATGYLTSRRKNTVMRRLAETSHMVFTALASVESISPFGEGWLNVVNVRSLHALVRHRLRDSPKYDAALYGTAVNQPDMFLTGITFSVKILEGLKKFGFDVPHERKVDYLHTWAYILYLLGVKTEYNALAPAAAAERPYVAGTLAPPPPGVDPVEHAVRARLALGLHQYHVTETSRTLAASLVEGRVNQPPAYRSKAGSEASAHLYLGNDFASTLGIARPSELRIAVFRARLWFISAIFAWLWDYSPAMQAGLYNRYQKVYRKLMAKFVLADGASEGPAQHDDDGALRAALRQFAFAMRWDPQRPFEENDQSNADGSDVRPERGNGSSKLNLWLWWLAGTLGLVFAVSLALTSRFV
ncbi:hypothetical protein H9P43_003647 [Blastocladiella emersonii ATCC 22665]|nr:hypothetical protein H9P43_003647 [Blastocladiella emersonii ATCC 22665]